MWWISSFPFVADFDWFSFFDPQTMVFSPCIIGYQINIVLFKWINYYRFASREKMKQSLKMTVMAISSTVSPGSRWGVVLLSEVTDRSSIVIKVPSYTVQEIGIASFVDIPLQVSINITTWILIFFLLVTISVIIINWCIWWYWEINIPFFIWH